MKVASEGLELSTGAGVGSGQYLNTNAFRWHARANHLNCDAWALGEPAPPPYKRYLTLENSEPERASPIHPRLARFASK